MSKNTKSRKNRKNTEAEAVTHEALELVEAQTQEAPETEAPEAFTPAPAEAEAAPETAETEDALTPAEAAAQAADAALDRLEEARAAHAATTETLRLAKLAVAETGKAAVRAARPQMTCLDAAFKVLLGWAEGRDAKQIVKEAAEKGWWKSPLGVTPWATVYAGMIREIAEKGENSRFLRAPNKKGSFIANPKFDPNA